MPKDCIRIVWGAWEGFHAVQTPMSANKQRVMVLATNTYKLEVSLAAGVSYILIEYATPCSKP